MTFDARLHATEEIQYQVIERVKVVLPELYEQEEDVPLILLDTDGSLDHNDRGANFPTALTYTFITPDEQDVVVEVDVTTTLVNRQVGHVYEPVSVVDTVAIDVTDAALSRYNLPEREVESRIQITANGQYSSVSDWIEDNSDSVEAVLETLRELETRLGDGVMNHEVQSAIESLENVHEHLESEDANRVYAVGGPHENQFPGTTT